MEFMNGIFDPVGAIIICMLAAVSIVWWTSH